MAAKIIILLVNILFFYTVTLIAQERDEVGHRVGPWSEGSSCGIKYRARIQYYYDDRNTPFTQQFQLINTGKKASFNFEVNSTGVVPDNFTRRITLENGQTYKNVETRNSEKVYFFFEKFCYNFHYFGMSERDDCSTDPSISKTKYYYAECGDNSNEKYISPTISGILPGTLNKNTITQTTATPYSNNGQTNSNTNTPNNDDCNFHALRCNKKTCPCPHNNNTTSNTTPLTPQEIQQQQQFSQQVQEQQRQKEQYDRQLQAQKQAWDKQLEEQREKLQKQKERQAYADQVNDAANQKAATNIQNTPITKLEVNKVDFKEVKKEPASGIDKATLAGIVESGKYETEFEEFSNKKENEIDDHVKTVGSNQGKIVLHNDNGVTLSYSYSIDNYYLCRSNYYDSYRIDVILENNSGKKITTRELSINHFNYYKTAKIDDKCNTSPGPGIKFVYETLEPGKRISKYYNLLVTKGYPVPKPDYNFNIEFKDVKENEIFDYTKPVGSIVLQNDNGVTLSYSYSIDNYYSCRSNYYDSYRIDVILENNSGKKITTRELSINHFNYYKNAKIDDKCNIGPGIKFVYETLETRKRISKHYNLLVTKGYPVPKPDYNFNIEFKDVTDNKWSNWEINQCYNQLQYRYKQIMDVGPYANMYYVDVEIKNGYSENIFFDLSLQNEYGSYIIGKHFGIRAGNGFTQRFGVGSDEKINLQVSKFCFGTDNSKTAKCDAERKK